MLLKRKEYNIKRDLREIGPDMKVGVIADTHLRQASRELEELMAGPFRDVEMVLHAGDITELAVLQSFAGKEIQAVSGNMDSPAMREERLAPPTNTPMLGS